MKRLKKSLRLLISPFVIMPVLTAMVLSGWMYSRANPILAQTEIKTVVAAPAPVPVNWGPDLMAGAIWKYEQSYALTATSTYTAPNTYIVDIAEDTLFGQGGWKPVLATPAPAKKQFQFSFTYLSNQRAEIGVDYILADGKAKYQVVREINPVKQPTKVTVVVKPIANAVSVRPSIQMGRPGHLETSDYSLKFAQ